MKLMNKMGAEAAIRTQGVTAETQILCIQSHFNQQTHKTQKENFTSAVLLITFFINWQVGHNLLNGVHF